MNTDKKIFINLSNHPCKNWSSDQLSAVNKLIPDAEIVEIPFPTVEGSLNEKDVQTLAEKVVKEVLSYSPAVVMCQGEFGLTFGVVSILKERGIKTVYSCSERRTTEKHTSNGTEKISVFSFVRFREY